MNDFLTAVKTVQKQTAESDPVLTVRSSQKLRGPHPEGTQRNETTATDPAGSHEVAQASRPQSWTSPDEALRSLRSEPDTNALLAILQQLDSEHGFDRPFTLATPGPLQAQIINALVNVTIPTFWSVLKDGDKALLVACLSNITGINALVAKLRSSASATGSQGAPLLSDLLDVADRLFHGDDFVLGLLQHLTSSPVVDKVKCEIVRKEVVNVLGSGKVVAAAAQAEEAVRKQDGSVRTTSRWLSKGSDYSAWLGRNIAQLVIRDDGQADARTAETAAQLLGKALNMGYPGALIQSLVRALVSHDVEHGSENSSITALVKELPAFTKRRFVEQTLRWLSDVVPTDFALDKQASAIHDKDASACAAFVQWVSAGDTSIHEMICDILSDPALTASLSLPVRRGCLAALSAVAPDYLQTLLEKTMTTFSDRLFINHAPTQQQESLAQTLLLTAGYLHRQTPMAVLMTARSSSHMQGTGNRLDASGQRARWLGMVVATAVSGLVDKAGSRMNFGVEEMRTEEAGWYMGLVKVDDEVGVLKDFDSLLTLREYAVKPARRVRQAKAEPMPTLNGKPVFGPARPPKTAPSQTEVIGERVTELLDDVDDEDDDDLKPYAKPDSDPEDSDEDATLVNRYKPRPPVYIRDLMTMLREDKDHDRFQLAIKHAASLVRRKANFGAEVKDHAEELLSTLCNLQDPFDTEDFDELRLQAMIAVLLSDVATLGPWLSRQAFSGEYSLAVRCVMLTALGLGGRELAGFKNEDELNPAMTNTDFPTKRLPPQLHAVYAPASSSVKRLESAAKTLEHQLIQPMALQAADQSTAHLNAVKVRTFSSRLSTAQRTKRKPAPNQLAKVFGPALFFPLANRYQQDTAAYGSGSVFASAPFLLVTFLKTLALLLHASGPATMGLPLVIAEFWDLLLSLRVQAAGDITILEAVLFALLTLLEVNTDQRRIADEHAKQLAETQQWVELVFERTGGGELVTGGSGEEVKVRALAAGVLVKTREVVEAYQKQLFGHVIE
ncbi:hypothetical protein LTR36_003012 [Oleoguttula mirabilis]|uniref:Telomere length regulation protein conserved domain-containing protein n=1 Tax=Oleoguttula mirabilis TaxID=1507867 RepID=A0AAV9JY81_9PEZI|nr:hypothetical protein LTR36_003012 [Oleoguttula mirabilis]